MRVAILHYHLRGGGVSRVISHACRVLADNGHQTVVIAGEPPASEDISLPIWRTVPGLAYTNADARKGPENAPEALLAELLATARDALGGDPDLWHIHNHSLGKNLALPRIVNLMAHRGMRLLLQIHDFSEDGRPDNYRLLMNGLAEGNPDALGAVLYPQGDHVHYAVLNCRDHGFLSRSGGIKGQVHLLANAVDFGPEPPLSKPSSRTDEAEERLVVYPTRAIRRKNLGEFLLWSVLGGDNTRWAVTLAPKNPAARPVYEQWVAFAEKHRLPVEFEFGNSSGLQFAELLRRADAAFTTSVAEGFGLAFLEPWLAGTPLLGRNLPEITAEFTENGVDLSHLYSRLDVPRDWLPREQLRQKLHDAAENSFHSYGRSLPHDFVDRALDAFVQGGKVDFGRLDEELQMQVLERLINSPDARQQLFPAGLPDITGARCKCFDNRHAVLDQYSIEKFGERLLRVYGKVAKSPHRPQPPLNAQELLTEFLAPERFCLLRT